MPSLDFTSSAFVIQGKPRFLAAGSMDYFRCPEDLWHDRILKAKRAGLNTIMTYVAWNQHEPTEGTFFFEKRSDIARFLRICAELEMFAIVRVGPFICDEFEAAGHPGWLIGKPGVVLRAPSPIAEPYIERWFKRLCEEIAPFQISHGGPMILVQAENEYYYGERPGGVDYLRFLLRTLRRNGIEVPITGCGNGSELQAPGYFETINGYGREANRNFHRAHPTWPLLISEHYTDWMDVWTWPQTDYPKRPMLEQESLEALSQQVMLSYFCFHGGTNFGFNGSSTWKTDHSWVTTRYWAQSPVAEGGALNPNYFAAKSASLPVNQFESFFATARPCESPLTVEGPVKTSALRSREGMFCFVLPVYAISADQRFLMNDPADPVALVEERPARAMEAAAGDLVLPTGSRVPLAAGSIRTLMLPVAFHVDKQNVIDYANATLLGVGGSDKRRVVFFWGDAGREGHLSINGVAHSFRFPHEEPQAFEVGGIMVFALSSEMADRTWFADGRVVIGAAFVGDRNGSGHRCLLDGETKFLVAVERDGSIKRQQVAPESMASEPAIDPGDLKWARRRLAEPVSGEEGWRSIDGPKSLEELGAYYGYAWYRARVVSSSAGADHLLFTSAADRAHIWINGRYSGVYGRGTGTSGRDLVPVNLPSGEAIVTMLFDNMGRASEGSAQQRKGILGPVYAGAVAKPLDSPPLVPAAIPQKVSWQFLKYRKDAGEKARCFSATWKLPVTEARGLLLTLRQVPQFAWIYWNGVLIGQHHGDNSLLDGFAASEYVLPPVSFSGEAELKVVFFGESGLDVASTVSVYSFSPDKAFRDWKFRVWSNPGEALGERAGDMSAGEPCWWETSVSQPKLAAPIFFGTQGLSKGQVYLNGEPMGRYWELGPQHAIYLPDPALKETNVLAVLEEGGRSPEKTFLMRDANVPASAVTF